MKSIRVLLAVSVFALCAGFASAADAPAKKEACPKDCDKPCCKKVCDKEAKCDKADKAKCDEAKKCCETQKTACCETQKMACCEEAAKAGKTCEKCNPPAKK